jgi:hypothetical protein
MEEARGSLGAVRWQQRRRIETIAMPRDENILHPRPASQGEGVVAMVAAMKMAVGRQQQRARASPLGWRHKREEVVLRHLPRMLLAHDTPSDAVFLSRRGRP